MSANQEKNYSKYKNGKLPTADTGNASNPSPHNEKMEPVVDKQWLGKQAETYLRESGNIEDEPDAQDQRNMDETIRKVNREKE